MSIEPRVQILVEYAKWTARAAVNVGTCPIKARKPIYRLLDGVAFAGVLSDVEVSPERFDAWHQRETEALCRRANKHLHDIAHENGQEPTKFPVGWSAKLINVFLKTAVYAGGLGREGLRDVLHPPLDNGLRRGLRKHFMACCPDRPDLLVEVDFGAISAIRDYDRYRRVIAGCRLAASCLECSLIEVEQLAGLGLGPGEKPPGRLVGTICRYVR